jgi:mannose-1-phosphate guanylyltransferase
MNYAVIMAGGSGKRLWPLSRGNHPKQVLKLFDGQTLLRRCYNRLSAIFDARNIIILTNAGYADIVREELSELPFNNVIAEPTIRDTAGTIGLAATILAKYDAEAQMAVVTADQIIEPSEVFQRAIKDAFTFIGKNPEVLITFGIQPTFPSTQLGYIKIGAEQTCPDCANMVYTVESFKEKPDEKVAREYLQSSHYLWNSGMFVWKAKTILSNLETFLPEAVEPLCRIGANWDGPSQEKTLEQWYRDLPRTSIDFAVMEKARRVYAIRLDCRWLDMGSFAALADVIKSDKDSNVVVADKIELLDCKNNIIATEDKGHLIAGIGLENIVIAHSTDATLVCPIGQTHRLKDLLKLIEQHGGERYL